MPTEERRALFAETVREREKALYRVALRACSEQREARYPTLAEFVADWRRAAGQTV